MNYSPMYMYESSGPMHIHKIILLTPRDRRQIVGVTLKVLRGRRGGGSDEAVRYKSRCSVALKDARFLRWWTCTIPCDVYPASASAMGGNWI